MALYALGDLHLSFQADKPMDAFGKVWSITNAKSKSMSPHRKARGYPCAHRRPFLGAEAGGVPGRIWRLSKDLPGRKILLRGNHDMFWDAKKTRR